MGWLYTRKAENDDKKQYSISDYVIIPKKHIICKPLFKGPLHFPDFSDHVPVGIEIV